MGFFDRYPYTNWHNVNLDWVLERVKEWGEMVEANDQAFKDLEEANASFKKYVENYLQNLNIQAQIDDKLDRMLEDGTLTPYLQPYVSASVTEWLEENITEPVGVVIDSSLTVAGAAADAKETGNRISSIFTNNAKSILMNAFRYLAWIDNSGKMIYDNLQTALFYGDVFNKWHYSLNDNDLIMTRKSANPNADSTMYPSRVSLLNTENRRNMSINYGILPYYVQNESETPSLYFPIPIPQTANKFIINMQPQQFVFISVVPYNNIRNWYDNAIPQNTITWTQIVTPLTKVITRPDDRQLFMNINLKYNSAGTDYPTDPTSFTIDFEN